MLAFARFRLLSSIRSSSFRIELAQILSNQNNPIRTIMSSSTTLNTSISSRVQLSIVGNGAGANPVSIAVTTDRQTHLFNCGEGVQRLVFEHKVKIGKIRNIYLTNVRHENFAGLFGFLLTVAPVTEKLSLYGPRKLEKIVQLYDKFMHHASCIDISYNLFDGLSTEQEEQSSTSIQLFEDSDLTIKVIPIVSASSSNCPNQISEDLSSAYLFLMKDKPGTLLIEKCKQLKIPPGPLFSSLKSGNEIELENGTIVKPEDVLGPCEPGPAFVVLECPTIQHVDSLTKNVRGFCDELDGRHLELIVHITPNDVFNDQRYREWLSSISEMDDTRHIVLNQDNQNELCLVTSSISQCKLNLIDKQIFRLLRENQISNYELNDDRGNNKLIPNCPTLLNYHLRPLKNRGPSFQMDLCRIDSETIQKQTLKQPEFSECLQNYQKNQLTSKLTTDASSKTSKIKDSDSFKSNILFLGTGSATPGILRNTSSILLNFSEDRRMLLDCGEATLLQLTRFYGRKSILEKDPWNNNILGTIRAVFISHIHADHHFGLIRLIIERFRLSQILRSTSSSKSKIDPLFVIGPKQIGSFLGKYFLQNDDDKNNLEQLYRFIPCNAMLHSSFQEQHQQEDSCDNDWDIVKTELLQTLSLDELVTVPVPHCYDSYGIVVKYSGQKIAYSGDSMFSDSFDVAARDCLVLIHEATMNDDLKDEAVLKRHSTISDAINVGRKIGAKFTMLTHFSQRYAKIAPINLVEDQSLSEYVKNSVGIAFDFMNVRLDELTKVVRMKSVLEQLFAEEIQELHDNRSKRAMKRKLIEELKSNSLNDLDTKVMADDVK